MKILKTNSSVFDAAMWYLKAGLPVIPIRGDGSKAPAVAWKPYQECLPEPGDVLRWFAGREDFGVGIVGGRDIEFLDFDRPGLYERFAETVEEKRPGLLGTLPRVATPSGGVHLYYKCETIAGNQKLAKDAKGKTLIETRGEGGYVVAPPSPPCCHPLNKPYLQVGGPDIVDMPFITVEDRELLFATARFFDEVTNRPGDNFNLASDWHSILVPKGWSVVHEQEGVVYWRKPNATGAGHHATTGHTGDTFYCFSTAAPPFDANAAYTKFTAYALLYHNGDFQGAARDVAGQGGAELPEMPYEAPDDPHRLARLFVKQCLRDGELTLRFWRDEWHHWDGSYRTIPSSQVRAWVCDAVKKEFDRVNLLELREFEQKSKTDSLRRGEERPAARKVTQGLVNNVLQALTGMTTLDARVEQPAWIGDDKPFSAQETLSVANGLVHLPTLKMHPPTPRFFSGNTRGYGFDANAPEPKEWLSFLGQLWPDDRDTISTLQEWFGYCLLPDTSQQKMLLVVGPKRSGKGTIARVLTEMVGPSNVAGPTLSSLATSFGLWPLIGKPVGIISDARLSGRTDAAVITERLLSISGEDTLTVDRKNLPPLHLKLPTRLVILTNELPQVNDASGALVGRMLLLRLTQSWYGKEDPALTGRLLQELPGILLWAIAGWRRLRERGFFVQPDSGKEPLDQLEDLGSPITAFLKECCLVGPDQQVVKSTLYDTWTQWCVKGGREHPGNSATFGRNLLAAIPTMRSTQPRQDGKRLSVYVGVGLAKC